jgi:predicted nucleotidyltransferase
MALGFDIINGRGDELAELCRRFGVRRLEVFGSAVTAAFDPQSSDLDFLVEYSDPEAGDPVERYFGLMEALERLFGRRVDLVVARAMKNPYFIREVNAQRRLVYAA